MVYLEGGNAEEVSRFFEGRDLTANSMHNYQVVLQGLTRFLQGKSFRLMEEEDLRRFMRANSTRWKTSSRRLKVALIKTFFRWLHGYRKHTYPPCVDWMQATSPRNSLPVVHAGDLVTEQEVKAMIDATFSTRDRALWMVLWEGAPRLGEVLSMRVGSVVFDEYGCYALVTGKTGQRRIRFVQATPYLREYLSLHPRYTDPQAWLWTGRDPSRRLYPSTVRINLEHVAKRAGVKKKVWPHLFRHSRLTVNAKFMTEAELCVFAGWRQGSKQPQRYIHLAGVDLDDKILAHYGLKAKEDIQREEAMKPIPCPRCGIENPATGRFCYQCSAALTLEEAMRLEDARVQEAKGLQHQLEEQQQAIKNLEQMLKLLSHALSQQKAKESVR